MAREWVEASITAGGLETRYLRTGRGRVMLLLTAGDLAAVLADPFLERLGGGFRVIAANVPSGLVDETPASFSRWLDGVIDGLGLERPAIVADFRDAPGLVRPEGIDPDRVACFLFMDRERPAREEDDERLLALVTAVDTD